MRAFYHLLANTTIAGVINFTVWFAITFFVFLQTRSVFATGTISGIYLVLTAVTSIWFGSIVDHNKKKTAMLFSSIGSLLFYALCFFVYISAPDGSFKDVASPVLWVFVLLLMMGVMLGNIRNIALPTTVTILVPEKVRDKANGLVGSAFGFSFLITSVISGVLVGRSGMYEVLLLALVVTIGLIIHLLFVSVPEKKIVHLDSDGQPKKVDLRGTFKVVRAIPGLLALVVFNSINNLLGGVFMALMDAYGLSLVSVEIWGFLWGVLSTGFIIGGLIIAKVGLGKNPVRTMFLANVAIWVISCFFTVYPSIYLLAGGMFAYLCIMPFIEASEQTIIQKVVPQERQGRVFGFAQSVEQMASPLTAFLIGPITQFMFIPYMTTGDGVRLIGGWFGTGPDRGIALVFTLTGIIGLIITLFAMRSKYYHQLSVRYLKK
jgi:DHA3 family multidrug efflux protein-like MFS transporter